MQIITPAIPKRLQITPGMVEDFVWDPVLAAWFFLGLKFDWFQRVRLKIFWLVPNGIDSSGFSSGKTITDWAYIQLRCLFMPESPAAVYYPIFEQGKRSFWDYYYRIGGSPIYRAHLGWLGAEGEEEGKSKIKGPSCYKAYFRNGARVEMPAVALMKESTTQLSTRFNTSLFEEWVQFDAAGDSINKSLLTRNTKPSFGNPHHPIWANHVKFTATAKTQLHPAYDRVKKFEAQIKKGNPKYFHIRFCYKDFSPGFKDGEGRLVRNDEAIKTSTGQMDDAEKTGEALGIWGKNTKGWYPESDLLRCVEMGKMAGTRPVSSRAEWGRVMGGQWPADSIKFFAGVDPAPAQSARNDDGSISILAVRPIQAKEEGRRQKEEEWGRAAFSDSPADYDCSFCYLKRLRNADATEWSAILHGLHRNFAITKMLMDMGASGGGLYIKKELAKPRQKIDGVSTECTPILSLEDLGVRGHFMLHAFKRKDPGIERLFAGMAGDDVLLDMAHTEMQTAIRKGLMKWPKLYKEWTQPELIGFGEENIWSLRNLAVSVEQFANMGVAMNEDKTTYDLTKNGARQFSAVKGRKDHMMSMMFAWISFLIWLRFDAGAGGEQNDEDAMGISGG